jgi:hypothetical protein
MRLRLFSGTVAAAAAVTISVAVPVGASATSLPAKSSATCTRPTILGQGALKVGWHAHMLNLSGAF